jgi:hypothetical protein
MLSAKAVKTTPVTKGTGWNVKNNNFEGSEYQKENENNRNIKMKKIRMSKIRTLKRTLK